MRDGPSARAALPTPSPAARVKTPSFGSLSTHRPQGRWVILYVGRRPERLPASLFIRTAGALDRRKIQWPTDAFLAIPDWGPDPCPRLTHVASGHSRVGKVLQLSIASGTISRARQPIRYTTGCPPINHCLLGPRP